MEGEHGGGSGGRAQTGPNTEDFRSTGCVRVGRIMGHELVEVVAFDIFCHLLLQNMDALIGDELLEEIMWGVL